MSEIEMQIEREDLVLDITRRCREAIEDLEAIARLSERLDDFDPNFGFTGSLRHHISNIRQWAGVR